MSVYEIISVLFANIVIKVFNIIFNFSNKFRTTKISFIVISIVIYLALLICFVINVYSLKN